MSKTRGVTEGAAPGRNPYPPRRVTSRRRRVRRRVAATAVTGVGLAVLVGGSVVAIGQMTTGATGNTATVAQTTGPGHNHRRHWPHRPHRPRPTTTTTTTTSPTATPKPTGTATTPPTTTSPPTTAPTTTTTAPTGGGQAGGAPRSIPKVGVPAGLTLKVMKGTLNIDKAGTVIDGADIQGDVNITAPNVTIKHSRISGQGFFGIYVRQGSLTLEDSTVIGFDNSVAGDNYTATRVEVTKANEDGFKIGTNVTIQDSYCHDLVVVPGAHSDCGQVQAGVNNAVVRRNWFDVGSGEGNSALFLAPDLGPSTPGPLVIQDNVLGGGNFTVQCVDGNNGQYFIKDITISGNKFLRNSRYGPLRTNVPVKASNNTFMDDGKAVTS